MDKTLGRELLVSGIVQGVGFRPFVQELASDNNLTGSVRNTPAGVEIKLFGQQEQLDEFRGRLLRDLPPLAQIDSMREKPVPLEVREQFLILPSAEEGCPAVIITPDAAICDDCRRELLTPSDRRYKYPFINCVNCGPRYSMLREIPYDRERTSMLDFPMCPECQAEYDNPSGRRHHAQGNCCAKCGPSLQLLGGNGAALKCSDPLATAAEILYAGGILAIKGLGGFHLACRADDAEAVGKLRTRKQRFGKPLAVMARNILKARELAAISEDGEKILACAVSPIILAPKRNPALVSPSVAPDVSMFGVMLPYTPLHILLMEEGFDFLVMTSGNLSEEPIAKSNSEAVSRLGKIADAFLVHDRDIVTRIDDSVCMDSAAPDHGPIIRRARGYALLGINTDRNVDSIAALGPMLKNTIAVGRGSVIYPSQHIGDLDNSASIETLHEIYEHMTGLLGVEPRAVACDTHPDYPSTAIAESLGLPVIKVQHHYAHVLACMAEHRDYRRSIGIAFDGTGYGDDGEIWGGEVFTFDPKGYRRELHLEYVPLPGGDRAAKSPWRMACSYLHASGLDPLEFVEHQQAPDVAALLTSDVKQFRTSSMGRLFDAVASICGICQENAFEAHAPMALEAAFESPGEPYSFTIENGVILTGEMIRQIAEGKDASPAEVSGRFHSTICEVMLRAAREVRDRTGLERVYLSGGVFMNSVVLGLGREKLERSGFTVYTHRSLPPNDGGVSCGQLLHAAVLLNH